MGLRAGTRSGGPIQARTGDDRDWRLVEGAAGECSGGYVCGSACALCGTVSESLVHVSTASGTMATLPSAVAHPTSESSPQPPITTRQLVAAWVQSAAARRSGDGGAGSARRGIRLDGGGGGTARPW